MSHFFLFPGQGSQRPGMASDFYEHSAPDIELAGTLDAANTVCA